MSTGKGWVLGLILVGLLGASGLAGYYLGPTLGFAAGPDDAADIRSSKNPDVEITTPADSGVTGDRSVNTPVSDVLLYRGLDTRRNDGVPKACFRFSEALDADGVIDDRAFVRIEPDQPISLQVDGSTLCVLGLDETQTSTVTIRAGFSATNDAQLRADLTETVSFDPKPAMVGFVGDGIILPRQNDSVLGIRAMNSDQVQLTLYRVNHRALFDQSPEIGETSIEGDWSWNSAAWSTRVEIHSETLDMSGAVNEIVEAGYAMESIVSEHGPGAYVVQLDQQSGDDNRRNASSWRWLYVTDLAIASYRSADSLHVTVRSITSARTVGDVKLTLIARNNDVLAEARTDATGRAKFPGEALRGAGNMAPKMLLAYAGNDDFAALDLARSPLDLTAYDVTGREATGPVDAWLYTERGVYRPGETVNLTALIRDGATQAAFDRDGLLIVRQPDGTEWLERRISPTDMAGAMIETIRIPRDAPRGRWTAIVQLDGLDKVGTVRFAVEDFIPEQLRLDLRADKAPLRPGEARELTVAADFLYGAKGRDLDAEAEVRISVDPDPFPQWDGYQFGDAVETYREQFLRLGDGRTDADGLYTASIDLAGDEYRSRSPLRAFVTAGIAEPGGRYVRDSLFLPLRSEDVYVGFNPLFDGGYAKRNTPAEIDLIAVNATGDVVAADATIALIREDYDYHWYREDGRWRYRRDRRDFVLEEAKVSLGADRPYRFAQALPYGQYRLQVTTSEGARFSYQFGSGWRRSGGETAAPDRIDMGLSQSDVRPGDTVVLSVNSPFGGVGELVVADRDVRTVQTVRIDAGESQIRLPIDRDWTTDLYAMLTVYTPGEDAQPRRAVGLVHIPADRSDQRLSVTLDTPERIAPRQMQDIVVQVAGLDGEEAFLTLAAVDSGILQITDFTPPDPEGHFFGKLAFPIDVFDDYARMLAPFSGADRVGGDSLGGAGLSVVPTQIVSLFHGPVRVRNGRATIPLDIPDFQGELTIMSVVWSETKIGSAASRMVVRDPVTAQLALPRFLAPGDNAVATVALDNIDGADGDYVVTVSRDDDLVDELTVPLTRGQRREGGVNIQGGDRGVSTFNLSTTGPDFDVTRNYQIETRAATLPETRTRFIQIDPGQSLSLDLTADRSGFRQGQTDTLISASFSPGLSPQPLLASLQRYPYGCSEQTTSVAMPLLLSESLGRLPDFSDAQRRASIQSAVETLLSRQSQNGTFGLWRRDDGAASPYLQLYISDFILQADADGFDIAPSARERTLDAVRQLAQLDGSSSLSLDYNFGLDSEAPDYALRTAERAAYAFALLARHDRVKKTELLYLDRRFGDRFRSSAAQSHLGYALAAMGADERANAAFQRAADRLNDDPVSYYDTDIRNAAMLLALSDDLSESALTDAMLTLQTDSPEQLNTHEKAWVLRALAGRRTSGVPFVQQKDWTASGMTATRSVPSDQSVISIGNDESAPVWLQVSVTGLPDGPMQARAQSAELQKSLFAMNGQRLSGASVSRGERMVVLLEASGTSRGSAMWVLADLLPAGFEIETVLNADDAGDTGPFGWLGVLSSVDMTEARDDRFVASWRTDTRWDEPARRLAYVLRATTQGDFALPGAHLEDMYRPSRMASTAGGRIAVTPPPTL
ncbi:alpha-2-macroglobulin [Algimonas porphyrae]|uniref:alpha-2-macroglobulin family protein n=1 Tax=Algimonas porphyrae TaxID=1128113 RepID=UPI0024E11B85|nr:alpha-2-macroglobulin [Algimonas porphyrae]